MASIEVNIDTIASALVRIANALELISAAGAPDVKTKPAKASKSKSSSEPEQLGTPAAIDPTSGFAGFPVIAPTAPECGTVCEPATTPLDANMPVFNMSNFLGNDAGANIVDCPIKTREDFLGMLNDVAGYMASKGINPNAGMVELLSRFGATKQSDITESMFPLVYAKVQQVKGGAQI